MELNERIRSRREELGMSQDELAHRCGYKSRSSINKIELGLADIPQKKVKLFASSHIDRQLPQNIARALSYSGVSHREYSKGICKNDLYAVIIVIYYLTDDTEKSFFINELSSTMKSIATYKFSNNKTLFEITKLPIDIVERINHMDKMYHNQNK